MKSICFSLGLLSFFCLTGCSFSPTENDLVCIQITDRNGLSETISSKERLERYQHIDFLSCQPYQQVVRFFSRDPKGKTHSQITSYHPNGYLWQLAEVVDGRIYGNYQEWHSNGQKKIQAFVIGGAPDLSLEAQKEWLFDGLCQVWDEQGILLSEIPYKKGFLEGVSTYYFPDGGVRKKIPYLRNEIHGEVIEYDREGTLLEKSTFNQGILQGPSLSYWTKEHLYFSENYEGGKLMEGSYFSPRNGSLVSEIRKGEGKKSFFSKGYLEKLVDYHRGEPEGRVEYFSSEGELTRFFFLKKGKKQGLEMEYFLRDDLDPSLPPKWASEKIPKISVEWEEDAIHGVVKTWYNNGKLESRKEMSCNKKQGLCYAWYRDGSLLLEEEYEDNLLVNGSYYPRNQTTPTSSVVKGSGTATLYSGEGVLLQKVFYQKGRPVQESN